MQTPVRAPALNSGTGPGEAPGPVVPLAELSADPPGFPPRPHSAAAKEASSPTPYPLAVGCVEAMAALAGQRRLKVASSGISSELTMWSTVACAC